MTNSIICDIIKSEQMKYRLFHNYIAGSLLL